MKSTGWNRLIWNAGSVGDSLLSSIGYPRTHKQAGDLVYKNRVSENNLFLNIGRFIAISTMQGELNRLVYQIMNPDATRRRIKKRQKAYQERADEIKKVITDYEADISKECGVINLKTSGGMKKIPVLDSYGRKVKTALVVSYNEKNTHDITIYSELTEEKPASKKDKNKLERKQDKNQYSTYTVFHSDPTAQITMNSTKNVVLTKVQGRDYSRKELISGGDLKFSVTGTITSNIPSLYPSKEVANFVKIMQYGGILDINFFMLLRLNVKQIIVTDFSLGNIRCMNEQPYSFNCVAVEPSEEIAINMSEANKSYTEPIVDDPSMIHKYSLGKKLLQSLKENGVNMAGNIIADTGTGGLDYLLNKNI